MKYLLSLVVFWTLSVCTQEFHRTVFDYQALSRNNYASCHDDIMKELEKSFALLDANQSGKALENAKIIATSYPECPSAQEVYALCLFRKGSWLEGLAILEKAIEKFGSIPELIKRRSVLSIEMGELGPKERFIDGNSVFLSSAKALPYDEEQFKTENLKSAQLDLEHLIEEFENPDDIFALGKIHQMLNQIEESNSYFSRILENEEYGKSARFNLADNLIRDKKFDEAESKLNELAVQIPRSAEIQSKLMELYEITGNSAKMNECKQKSEFYELVPEFTELAFNASNYQLLKLFANESKTGDEKIKKLKELVAAKNEVNTIGFCLVILNMHLNHGNGLEEEATKVLSNFGFKVLPKVHYLFISDISTCTVANLAEIMVKNKDEKSWELLVKYAKKIPALPATVIPPDIPSMLIQFDEQKGMSELLKIVKDRVLSEKTESDNPLEALNEMGNSIFYIPLSKLNRKAVLDEARKQSYTSGQLSKLSERLNDYREAEENE